MINLEWVAHRSGVHQMFPSSVDIQDGDGNRLVTSYAVHRPDGNWSLLLVNRDQGQRSIRWSRDVHHHRARGETANYRYKWTGQDLADFIAVSI